MMSDRSPAGRTVRPPRESWSAVLSWSMLAATAVHAMAFALSPSWEVSVPFLRHGAGVALLEPAVAAQALAGPELGGPLRPREARAPEVADPRPQPAESVDEALAAIDPPAPAVVEPVPAVAASEDLDLSPVAVPHRAPVHAQVESANPDALWREILNVEQVIRFLRTSYNHLFETTGARGYAVIQVWVDARGRVAHSAVYASSGQDALDRIALELFDDVVRFEPHDPGRRGGLTSAVIGVPFHARW